MSNSPWEIQKEESFENFGKIEIEMQERRKADGSSYWAFKMHVQPFGRDSQEWNTVAFSRGWNTITLPSIHKMVSDGKLKSPNDLSGSFISWTLEDWADYAKKTIKWHNDNKPEKIEFDDKGKEFVTKKAIKFTNVFSSENECFQASGQTAATQEDEEVPWEEAPKTEGVNDAAKSFVPILIKQCLNGGNRVNLNDLGKVLNDNSEMLNGLTVDSDFVKEQITKVESQPAF